MNNTHALWSGKVLLLTWLLCAAMGVALAVPPCDGGVGPRLRYVSQEIPGSCGWKQLQNLINEIGPSGTLVVDKQCILTRGLILPTRFALRGLGLGLEGQLIFTHDGVGITLCALANPSDSSNVTIADLDLYGPNPAGLKVTAPHAVGISLLNQNIVFIHHVRISNFFIGVAARNTLSVQILSSNISDNRGDNVQIGYGANGWRIRDGLISRAGRWGINVLGPGDAAPFTVVENGVPVVVNTSNDLLVDGVRMEFNAQGAVRTNAYGSRITHARFEYNGAHNTTWPFVSVLAASFAQQTRILTNLFSNACVQDNGVATQRAFNIPMSSNVQECL